MIMDINNKQSKSCERDISQKKSKTKNQQQEKKGKLALALRENLRRRKAAVSPAPKAED